jgi:hypothetical protein
LSVRFRIKYDPVSELARSMIIRVDDFVGKTWHPKVMDELYVAVDTLCHVRSWVNEPTYSDIEYECPVQAIEEIKRLITEFRGKGWIIERKR